MTWRARFVVIHIAGIFFCKANTQDRYASCSFHISYRIKHFGDVFIFIYGHIARIRGWIRFLPISRIQQAANVMMQAKTQQKE